MLKSFPFYRQPDQMDCGPTCLRIVAKFYGLNFNLQTLRNYSEVNKDGVSLLGISNAAEKIGFRTTGALIEASEIKNVNLPIIIHWGQKHFVVLYKIKNNKYYISDPAKSLISYHEKDFLKYWIGNKATNQGIALLLNPTQKLFEQENETSSEVKWSMVLGYLSAHKKLVIQLILGLTVGSLLLLIAPFLTQSIVDIGINTKNLSFIYIIMIAQIMLIFGRTSIDFIRAWILLHLSTRVNVAILTDFLIKLMKLPISYFDTKMTGDLMQRMNDQHRIEDFLTGSALNSLFSIFNLIIFSIALASFDITIFLVVIGTSILYFLWVILFLKRRRILNYKSFEVSSKNQSSLIQLINGMQEIKLNNYEKQKRWEWEHIQARLFKINIKTLSLSQIQQGGATCINELSNVFVTLLSAKAVIDGHITLGGMVAVQYIIGQLNNPIQQFINFSQSYQDAKISLERLNEIYQIPDEESTETEFELDLPKSKDIFIKNLTFKYPGAGNEPVLKNINIKIPQGKITAIVGMSGSGKTTILKLLLRFYNPLNGEINIGGHNINRISFKTWRSECGIVMQDGFIFSDTIKKNIAPGSENIDKNKLELALKISNINDFVETLPLGLDTKIGAEGNGISQGQKQRILIARSVYKNPEYIFFDEATNALDANNEKIIMENLDSFFKDRTVVIVAHRLSTVKNAHNIIVLDQGEILEQGTHLELTAKKGSYYALVKNQLELGN